MLFYESAKCLHGRMKVPYPYHNPNPNPNPYPNPRACAGAR